ncbi:IS3 family transposase [Aminipila butyrica]|uniref:IS3 family transposase n=1 Tax=Aminipila butyrica TaxID=433296 RepID=A0A858C070_9FIRM|nr:IS3 family transposase [Aminipila butyrica]
MHGTFKAELIDYIDYYNNRRIKAKLKGLPPAFHRHKPSRLLN